LRHAYKIHIKEIFRMGEKVNNLKNTPEVDTSTAKKLWSPTGNC
jgi:hypothetical protein